MEKNKIIFVVIIVFVVVSAVALYNNFNKSTENSAEVDEIVNDNKTFIVGFDTAFPPFEYENSSGDYVGFDLDVCQEIADRNGWELIKKPINWNEKDYELETDQIDCIWLEYPKDSKERDNYAWTKPVLNLTEIFVVGIDSGINSTGDLSGKVLELQEGSESENLLFNDNTELYDTFKKVIEVSDYDVAFEDINSQKCDVIILDKVVALYNINVNSYDLKIIDEPISVEPYCIAFTSNNTDLSKQVDKTLDELHKDGTIDKIAEKYDEYGISELVN